MEPIAAVFGDLRRFDPGKVSRTLRNDRVDSVLFLPQTTRQGASSRARVYEFLPFLQAEGFRVVVRAGTTEAQDRAFLRGPSLRQKILWFWGKIVGRLSLLPWLKRFDCVYLHRETLPYFFPFVELLQRRFCRRLIFDFDDAVFHYPKAASRLKRALMDPRSADRIIAAADRVIVSTRYLAEYARRINPHVVVIPTCIRFADFEKLRRAPGGRPVIGWIGSASTQHYLKGIAEPLERLAKQHDFVFRVIGAQRVDLPNVPVDLKPWSLEREAEEIASFTIGVMPLPDDPWTRGKGGYKLLQYMAAGVPAIGSRVGANCDIIEDGVNGFLASDPEEWFAKLERLLTDAELRERFARRGRQVVRERYSIEANAPLWLKAVTQW